MSTAIVTGGCGFIGSHLTEKVSTLYSKVVVVDSFTYAARNVKFPNNVYIERCDIRDHWALSKVFDKYRPKIVYHLAAESHVCRSIEGPRDFVHTNILGTWHVAEECRRVGSRLVHISTDEVFGEIKKGRFDENSRYAPRSPYAASKASADHLVKCYGETFALDFVICHPSNNFGPNQHEEKLIPRTIKSLFNNTPITVYGKGDHVREWIYVGDCVDGIIAAGRKGKRGNSYCLGGWVEFTNLGMISRLQEMFSRTYPAAPIPKLVFTDDRPTDDFRYASTYMKAQRELGWKPDFNRLEERLQETMMWYAP